MSWHLSFWMLDSRYTFTSAGKGLSEFVNRCAVLLGTTFSAMQFSRKFRRFLREWACFISCLYFRFNRKVLRKNINCKTCDSFYVGETSLKLKDRLQQHDRALKIHDRINALVVHRKSTHHAIDLKGAKIICNVTDLTKRRIIEAAAIDRATTMKQRPGFYNISPYISEMILKENKVNF